MIFFCVLTSLFSGTSLFPFHFLSLSWGTPLAPSSVVSLLSVSLQDLLPSNVVWFEKYSSRKFRLNALQKSYVCIIFAKVNDTHRERLVVHSISTGMAGWLVVHSIHYRNDWLAASNLFDMFTQSIKFYTFHYQYRCLKNVIHQIDSKNGWLLLSASFTAKFGLIFVLTLENAFY